MKRLNSIFVGIAVLLLPIGATGAALALYLLPDPMASMATAVPASTTPALISTETGEQPAELNLAWATGPAVVAPAGWDGVITAIDISATEISEGDCVVEINAICRMAVATTRPFHRTLDAGTKGDDVRMLNELLKRIGLPAGSSDQWTRQTLRGVHGLQKRLGYPTNEEADQFDPACCVWIPSTTVAVAPPELAVGMPAPLAGDEVARVEPRLTSAVVADEDGIPLRLSAEREWTAMLGAVNVPVQADGTIDGREFGAVQKLVAANSETTPVLVRLAEPMDAYALPPAAVLPGDRSGACVWIVAGDSFRTVPVEIVGGDVGTTRVVGALENTVVLTNPAEHLGKSSRCR